MQPAERPQGAGAAPLLGILLEAVAQPWSPWGTGTGVQPGSGASVPGSGIVATKTCNTSQKGLTPSARSGT
ncbi:hypothetical protein PABY_13520 [Pyrodictium abyssi]|uniref:Uncharacterized protein n=1 Tax=Pyrodictium abyssi TaxID=54256 RepID=A0ABN6ZT01_9CREN|nr:hypothetical protein PABY_13520 [Pyrodictium abyssi]